MDRGFTLAAGPEAVWPWIVQLGKKRAGWYLPRRVERFLPRTRRAARSIEPRWQRLEVGDVIPDYGGPHESFEVAFIDPAHALVYRSQRRHTHLSWSISLLPVLGPVGSRTRIHLRLRLAPIRHPRLAGSVGELLDLLSVAGLAVGLEERLTDAGP